MNFVLNSIGGKKLFFKLILWFRSLLTENKIPTIVLYRLNAYIPSLSKNVPNIQAINKCLENDINYLNSREELRYIKHLESIQKKKRMQKDVNNQPNLRRYNSIRIISYQDIIEVESILDRVFVIEIDMDDPNNIYSFYEQAYTCEKKAFQYSVKLSTVISDFPNAW